MNKEEVRKVPGHSGTSTTTAEDIFRFQSKYKYIRQLGSGAYGLVCSALDLEDGHTIAIKRINQLSCSVLVARRTLRELKLLRHFCGHPNIVSIFNVFTPREHNLDEVFIAQELMDADLCHIIQSRYALSEEHIRRFLFQILRGLEALHAANVIHRDLKPGNLLWKHNGEIKICDFGLARGIDDKSANHLDGPNELAMTNYVATRWYRPPEILLSKSAYGKPLDIWSVGCIMAELYGRRVFLPGASGFEQLHLILQKMGTPSAEYLAQLPSSRSKTYLSRLPVYPKIPLSHRFPGACAEGLNLLERMLEFDPAKRISASEALRHPYFAHYQQHLLREPSTTPFDFSFDRRLETIDELRGALLEEIRFYQAMTNPFVGRPLFPEKDQNSTSRRSSVLLPPTSFAPYVVARSKSIAEPPSSHTSA